MNLALLLNLQGARKRGDADRVNNNNNNVALTLQFSLTALLNLRLLASKRPASSGSDLNRRPLLAKQIKTDEDRKKDNIEELIYISKVKHTYVQAHTVPYSDLKKYLSNSITDPTGREFAWTNIRRKQASESPLGLLFLELISMTLQLYWLTPGELGSIYVLRSVDEIWANVADVFDTVVSKLDEVPTREPSSYIKTELLRDNSCKFYCLVITSEDTHCKQIIKKAYIMSLERALLILFMI
ncbi:hypothetical protein HBI88_192140 [Parastagonospora nodorum]|nr:hypothetical protein HBI97_209960 [Parastagonospora nodorum]KAH5814226.1 hypothetical protein HBI96_069530 [Parastagonospora nodorum]KAH5828361.1 hypothetical protein HBI94_053970 [Parastagonospora nodorum]KAH5838523.1 hypothetical protein HBI93_072220 [Parastagonospora nodorum]KAH5854915.1 hypothetical protein HBI90_187460 [Parastagonospora nodorum]